MTLPSPHLRFPARCFSSPCAAPWDVLDSPSPAATPGFLWRGREDHEVWLGLGWAGVFASFAECRAALRAVDLEAKVADFAPRCFAMCAFDPETPLSAPWENFHARLFVLPETLIRWRDGQADVMLIRPVFGSVTHQDLHADFESATAQAKLLLLHSEPRRPFVFRAQASSFDPAAWSQAMLRIQQEIRGGSIHKAVLARAQQWSANHPLSSAPILERLASSENACSLFAHRMSHSVFLGATPERLFHLRGCALEVESLAGTRPRGRTADEDQRLADDLLRSTKDIREQQVVTAFLSEHLSAWSSGDIHTSELRLQKLTHVQHLLSTVSTHIRPEIEPDAILAALHPTPAVCGVPRAAAMSLLRELEPQPRGLYAGAFGWVTLDDIEMTVAIRSALLCETTAHLFAGAGIVAESDPQREWEETEWKLRPLQQALEIEP